MDNLGEAADLSRKLWLEHKLIGQHYTVTKVIPQILDLLKKYNVSGTYFVEAWNINVYGPFILNQIIKNGHELGWHAWQHKPWAKLGEQDENANFERSFGKEGLSQWTLKLCKKYGLSYLSPAAENAAIVNAGDGDNRLVVLPFKWATVDAYYYMETFAGLQDMKGEYASEPQSPQCFVQHVNAEIDKAIERGSFLSILFHPFLTDRPERVEALEAVLKRLVEAQAEGKVWLAPCKDVATLVEEHPDSVSDDPQ